jgi:hypothetical protein
MSSSDNCYTLTLDANLARLVGTLDEDAREFYEERAGILEFEAGLDRAKAEKMAWNEVQRYLKARIANKSTSDD